MKKHLLILIFLSSCFLGNAQTIIQGKVTDLSNGNPLIGAFISIKNTKLTAVSELNGTYQIIVPSKSTVQKLFVVVNHLGFMDVIEVVEILPIDDGESIIRNFELEPDPLTIKNVTVTANRVEEELQDVPIAATVISAKDMENRSVADTEEALAFVPNLVTDAYLPSRATFSLRGLASDFTNLGVENSVGLYIDDVFYSRSFNFNQTLMDVDRVEVLRGPQGTLFGKNTIGGVLHIIPEQPKFDNFASVELNAGNFNYLQVRGKGNIELVDNVLALRVSGAYRKRDGWLLEKNNEISDENGILFYGGRTSLRWQASKKIDVTLKGTYTEDEKAEFTIDYKTPDDGFNRIPVLVNSDIDETLDQDRRVFQNEDVFFNRKNYGGVGKVNIQLDDVHKLTSITSANYSESAFLRDFDASTASVGTFGKVSDISTFTQEIRIATPRENRKFFYIGGLFFLQETLNNSDTLRAREDIAPIWEAALSQAIGVPIDLPEDYEETVFNKSTIDSKSYAAYFSGSYEFSERIRFNAGIRFSREEKEIDYHQGCDCLTDFFLQPMALLVAPPNGSADAPLHRTLTNNALSGNVGLDFKTTDKILLYINFARGFKGAGFNVSLSPEADPAKLPFTFKQEVINSYEIGLKLKANNRYRFNLAAFVTDFQDKQEVAAVQNVVIVDNADAVQGQGLEVEFTGIWTDFFKTDIALGALNMKYTDFEFDNPFTPEVENLSGNRALKASPFTFKFAPEFHTKIGRDLKLLARVDYNFVGKTFNDIFNTEGLARQPTGTLNARISISTKNERFGISLWGKNLTDATYVQHGWSFIFGDHVAINPPRLVGMELRVNFY